MGRFPPAPWRDYLQVVRHDGAAVGAGEPTPEDGSTSQREPVLVSMTVVSPFDFPQVFSSGPVSLSPSPSARRRILCVFPAAPIPGMMPLRLRGPPTPASSPGSSRIQTEVGSTQAGGAIQPHLVPIDGSWIA